MKQQHHQPPEQSRSVMSMNESRSSTAIGEGGGYETALSEENMWLVLIILGYVLGLFLIFIIIWFIWYGATQRDREEQKRRTGGLPSSPTLPSTSNIVESTTDLNESIRSKESGSNRPISLLARNAPRFNSNQINIEISTTCQYPSPRATLRKEPSSAQQILYGSSSSNFKDYIGDGSSSSLLYHSIDCNSRPEPFIDTNKMSSVKKPSSSNFSQYRL